MGKTSISIVNVIEDGSCNYKKIDANVGMSSDMEICRGLRGRGRVRYLKGVRFLHYLFDRYKGVEDFKITAWSLQ